MSIHSHRASDFYFMHLYSEIMCEVLSKEASFHSTVQVGPTVLIKGSHTKHQHFNLSQW